MDSALAALVMEAVWRSTGALMTSIDEIIVHLSRIVLGWSTVLVYSQLLVPG